MTMSYRVRFPNADSFTKVPELNYFKLDDRREFDDVVFGWFGRTQPLYVSIVREDYERWLTSIDRP
jgi:hypothetical protein